MGKSAEHDMRHDGELALDGGAQMGVVVAVTGRPPGGYTIDELAFIRKQQMRLPCVRTTGSGARAVFICE